MCLVGRAATIAEDYWDDPRVSWRPPGWRG